MSGLLPKNYVNDFKMEKIFRLCLGIIFYISLVLIFGIFLLTPSYFVLKFSLNDTLRQLATEESSLRRRDSENIEQKMISLNSMLRDHNRNELRKFSFSNLLISFINSSVEGIKLNGIDFDKNQNNTFFIRLSGESASRNNIIAYTNSLKNLIEVSEVRSPITNLLKDVKSKFIIEADIKKEFYEQK